MKKISSLILGFVVSVGISFDQENSFDRISFILGDWYDTGSGFGNDKSRIESSFRLIMSGNYIEV